MPSLSSGSSQGSFGSLLRGHRERLLVSREDLAERAGLSVRTLGYLESGKGQRPRPGTVRLLADALGLEGPARERFEAAAVGRPEEPAPAPANGPVPAQLPGDVTHFVGRDEQLTTLDRLIETESTSGSPAAVVVSAVSGTAGVGKTALVVHWAHRRSALFPDGQLFLDLRGYGVEGPVPVPDALNRLLHGVGVPPSAVPVDVEERAALLRSRLQGRRMLLVLDNAQSAEQVRPLLPGTSSCLTIVTSRSSLAGLVARHGARRVDVELFSASEAEELLRALIGPQAAADPAAVSLLAARCARLPLALRVAADLASRRPGSVAGLAAELADEGRRLRLLDADGDPGTAVEAVLSWSYRQLPRGVASAFQLVGLHSGPHIDERALAAMAGIGPEEARYALHRLETGHLVQHVDGDRYWLHDLLHAYARELAESDPLEQRERAVLRLSDHYVAAATRAAEAIFAPGVHRRPDIASDGLPTPEFADDAAAVAWLDVERCVLANPALPLTPAAAMALSELLWGYLYNGCHTDDAAVIHQRALDAARAAGDLAGEANALRCLATVAWRRGDLPDAADLAEQAVRAARAAGAVLTEAHALAHGAGINGQRARYDDAERGYGAALELYRRSGVRYGEAVSLVNLGVVHERRGRLDLATEHYERGRSIAAEIGYEQGLVRALMNLAEVGRQRGAARAEGYYRQVVELARRRGTPVAEAQALDGLGMLHLAAGRLVESADVHRRALALFREVGNQVGEGWALDGLAAALVAQGRAAEGLATYGEAASIFDRTGDRTGVISSRNGCGDALCRLGRAGEALVSYEDARRSAAETGDRSEEARALAGLADATHRLGDLDGAARRWAEALAIYTELGMAPKAAGVRRRLDGHAAVR